MSNEQLTSVAGIVGAALTFGLPLLAWALAIRPWRAGTRIQWAVKGALWPAVVLSFGFARPIMYLLFGIGESSVFVDSVYGFLGGLIVASPIGAVVGAIAYSARGRSRSQGA